MKTRYRVFMDGRPLDEISDKIVILDVQEAAPEMNITTAQRWLDGAEMRERRRDAVTVSVVLEIHEYDIQKRTEIVQLVNYWARDGILTANTHPGQRLKVICTGLLSVKSALKWTEALTLGFRSTTCPYWESETATTSAMAEAGTASFTMPGTADGAPVSVTVTNDGDETMNALTVAVNDTRMIFAGLGIAPGGTLAIGYDDAGRLYIRAGNTSKMAARTAESNDDLLARAGVNTVTLTAAAASAILTARGRWK